MTSLAVDRCALGALRTYSVGAYRCVFGALSSEFFIHLYSGRCAFGVGANM